MAERAPDVAIGSLTLRGPGLDPGTGERVGHQLAAGLAALGGGRAVELGAIHVRVASVDDIVPAVLRAARRAAEGDHDG